MIPPCVTVNEKLLNPVRTLLIHRMYSQGLTQNEIAGILKISQVSVNRYLRKDPEEVKQGIIKLGLDSNKLEIYLNNILKDAYSNSDTFTLCLMCMELRLHKFYFGTDLDIYRYLDQEKNIHDIFMGFNMLITGDRLDVLSELNRQAHRLENIVKFSKIIPPYGSEFVYSLLKPKVVDEIAGLPSRIINYHGKPRIFIGPEFGYNSEISNLLISISEINSEIRSGISIVNNESLLSIIERYFGKNLIDMDDFSNKDIGDFIFVNKKILPGRPPEIILLSTDPAGVVEILTQLLKYY